MRILLLRSGRSADLTRHVLSTFLIIFLLLTGSGRAASVATTPKHDNASRLYHVHQNWLNLLYGRDSIGNRTVVATNADDYDFDDLVDVAENARCASTIIGDSDIDGIPDNVEDANHNGIVDNGETDPCNPDTDGDGIWDGTEAGCHRPAQVPLVLF